jgi:hypothetical protein
MEGVSTPPLILSPGTGRTWLIFKSHTDSKVPDVGDAVNKAPVEVPDEKPVAAQNAPETPHEQSQPVQQLQQFQKDRPSFTDIALKYGTDKVTDHHYQFMYEKYLAPIRDESLKMLEIGLGCDMVSTSDVMPGLLVYRPDEIGSELT